MSNLSAARRPLFLRTSEVSTVDLAALARDERDAGFLTRVCAWCFPPQESPELAGLDGCLTHGACDECMAKALEEVR